MTILTVNVTLLEATAVLSLPAAQENGAMAWTGSVSIDRTGGTLWRYAHPSAQNPDAATIKANGQISVPVTTGAQSLSGSGLSAGTAYRVSYYHETTGGSGSNIVRSSEFTTDALGSGSGTVTISILDRSSLEVAPEPVFFEAAVTQSGITDGTVTGAWDQAFHEVVYIWHFDDAGAQSDKVVNLPSAHNDLNTGYGKYAAHVFTAPGTYTVTCTCYLQNGDLIGSDTQTVTVGDPNTAFPTTQTILVDPANVGDNTTYPGSQVVTTFDAAIQTLVNLSGTGRILIKRGISISRTGTIGLNSNFANFYVSTYGTGARPVITYVPTFSMFFSNGTDNFSGDFVWDGVDVTNGWNPQTETGTYDTWAFLRERVAGCTLVNDCVISNFDTGIDVPLGNGCLTVANNCGFDNFARYGLYTDGTADLAATIGCRIVHDPLSRSGGSGDFGAARNNQGNIRVTAKRWVFSCLDLFSRQSWTPALPAYPWEQPALRYNPGIGSGVSCIIERVAAESTLGNARSGSAATAFTFNAMIEKCLVVATAGNDYALVWDCPGLTARNNIFVAPNMPYHVAWSGAVQLVNTAKNSGGDPTRFYSNTAICNLTSANRDSNAVVTFLWGSTGLFTNTLNQNNVVAAPNQPGREPEAPVLTTVNMPTVGGVWTSRYLGPRLGSGPIESAKATPPGSVKDYRPDVGSPLIGSATGTTPYDDFYGMPRGANPDRGAVERV